MHEQINNRDGVSCRLLLARDYARGHFDDADWEVGGVCRRVITLTIRNVVPELESRYPQYRVKGHAPSKLVFYCSHSRVVPDDPLTFRFGELSILAVHRGWVEQSLEESGNDQAKVADRLANLILAELDDISYSLILRECGVISYIEQHPEASGRWMRHWPHPQVF